MVKKSSKTSDKLARNEKGQLIPGQRSLNPDGRPPGSVSLVSIMKRKLQEVHPGHRKQYAEALVESILDDALMLDGPSRKLVMQYIEGLPTQKTELTHILPKPLDDVSENESLQENKTIEIKNTGSTGGDISEQDSEHPAVFDSEVSV